MPDEQSSDPQKKNFMLLIAKYSGIGLMLPAATFVGWVIGALLDKWLHTTSLYLVGVIVGSIAGLVELIRTVSGSEPKE